MKLSQKAQKTLAILGITVDRAEQIDAILKALIDQGKCETAMDLSEKMLPHLKTPGEGMLFQRLLDELVAKVRA